VAQPTLVGQWKEIVRILNAVVVHATPFR
jgi:hypothetical protein